MKKLTVALGFVALSTLAACHFGPEKRASWITSKISGELDLNNDQKAKLENVKRAFLDVRKSHQAEQKKHLDEMKQIILADKLDSAKIKSLMAQRDKTMMQDLDVVFGKMSDFHSSLTAEQKKKAVEMLENFASKWNTD